MTNQTETTPSYRAIVIAEIKQDGVFIQDYTQNVTVKRESVGSYLITADINVENIKVLVSTIIQDDNNGGYAVLESSNNNTFRVLGLSQKGEPVDVSFSFIVCNLDDVTHDTVNREKRSVLWHGKTVQVNQVNELENLTPIALASASAEELVPQSKTYGEKVNTAPARRTDFGLYTVPHRVGHENYTVQITPRTGGRACYIVETKPYHFKVQFTDLSGGIIWGVKVPFDYSIIGEQ